MRNITESQFAGLAIYQTRKLYSRNASGAWKRKPDEVDAVRPVTPEQYINAAQKWFRSDRIEMGYTYAGYIPVKVTSYSPDGQHKMVWTWYQTVRVV